MLLKSRELEGRAILASSTGAVIAHCKGVVFDAQARQVLALLADEGGWFRGAKVVPFARIESIGETAVMVDTPEAVAPAKGDDAIMAALERKQPLIGLPLINARGDAIGRIADIAFDFPGGRARQIEVKSGLLADLASGRQVIEVSPELRIGPDSGVVPDSALAAARHEGGVQQVARVAGQRASEVAASVSASAAEAAEKARVKLAEASESTRETMARSIDRAEEKFGEVRARAESTYGEVKAKAETTFEDVKAKAETTYDDVKARAETTIDGVRARAESSYDDVKARTGEAGAHGATPIPGDPHGAAGADRPPAGAAGSTVAGLAAAGAGLAATLGARAEGLIGKAKTWASEQRETVDGKLDEREKARRAERDERRIRASLGRPVNRVIFTPQDMVILPAGGIVTNLAVDTARQHGVLDMLLDSVDLDANLAGYAQTPADPDNPEWTRGLPPV